MWVSQLHVLAAMWLFTLVAVHLGFHAGTMIRSFHVFSADWTTPPRKATIWFVYILAAVVGVRAGINRNLGAKLIMYYSFDFSRGGDSVVMHCLDYLAIMFLITEGTRYIISPKKHDVTSHLTSGFQPNWRFCHEQAHSRSFCQPEKGWQF